MVNSGNQVDLFGHLHCGIFNTERASINGVEMRIRLVRTSNAFFLMSFSKDCSIKFVGASLAVRQTKIGPSVLLVHTGDHGDTLIHVILGQLPKRIIIGFVNNIAFNSDRKLRPFNFK